MRISTVLIILGVGVGLGVAGANLPRLFGGGAEGSVQVTRNVTGVQVAPAEVAEASGQRAGSEQLTQIVAAATKGPLKRDESLTAEQEQIVAFFERTAREMNEVGGQRLNRDLEFDHLAINGLDVRYYYTVRRNYADLNPAVVLEQQQQYINATVCADAAVRELISQFGFRYSYAYLSSENRLIGKLDANLDGCTG